MSSFVSGCQEARGACLGGGRYGDRMMQVPRSGAAVGVVALLLLAGCASSTGPSNGGTPTTTGPTTDSPDDASVVTLAKADGWRQGLDPTSIPGEAGFAVLELAYDDAAATALWNAAVPDDLPTATGDPTDGGLYGSRDDVDLTQQVLGLWSSGQSGSCPGWLTSMTTDGDRVQLVQAEDLLGGNGCDDSYNPYSQVVILDRDQVPTRDALPLDAHLTFAILPAGTPQLAVLREFNAVVTTFDE